MKTLYFTITLEQDTILTESAASTGPRSALGYVPGGVVLGVAAKNYAEAEGAGISWGVFHSGQVRFSNAYPIIKGEPSLPVPLTWREGKNAADKASDGIRLQASKLCPVEGKQLKLPFFTGSGGVEEPALRRRQRTAMDRKRGGQSLANALFEDVALAAPAKFWFSVSVEPSVETPELFEFLVRSLEGGCVLGADRNIEYGRARIEPAPEFDAGFLDVCALSNPVLYCLSDLLTDDPLEVFFENHGVKLDLATSTLRRRADFAPFNAHRGCFGHDRAGFLKGSVLRFRASDSDRAMLKTFAESGIGTGRAAGFGSVLLNPWFLEPNFKFKGAVSPEVAIETEFPNDPLFEWAAKQSNSAKVERELEAWVDATLEKFAPLYTAALAEAYATGEKLGDIAPTRSQWGTLRNAAISSGSADALKSLEERTRQVKWRGKPGFKFLDALNGSFGDGIGGLDKTHALAKLCEKMPRRFSKEFSK